MTLTAHLGMRLTLAAVLSLWVCVPVVGAFAAPDDPGLSENVLPPLTDQQAWSFFTVGDAKATLAHDGAGVLVEVTYANTDNWHVQLVHPGAELQEGRAYVLRFRAKADTPRTMGLVAGLNQPDYHTLGLLQDVQLTTDWQDYTVAFTATKVVPGKMSAPQFQFAAHTGKVWLTDIFLGAVQPRSAAPPGPADSPLRPQPGEVRLEGTVRDTSPPQRRLTLLVMRAQDPGGPAQSLDPPRQKVIAVRPDAVLRVAGNGQASLGAFQPGDSIIVIGKSLGNGKPLVARLIAGQ